MRTAREEVNFEKGTVETRTPAKIRTPGLSYGVCVFRGMMFIETGQDIVAHLHVCAGTMALAAFAGIVRMVWRSSQLLPRWRNWMESGRFGTRVDRAPI